MPALTNVSGCNKSSATTMRLARRLLLIVWVSPASLLGLLVGLLGLATGGGVQRAGPVLEFYGGAVTRLLQRGLLVPAAAMTLGHVILGQTPADLHRCRTHEMVHVRQYERWGPAFIPAYLAASFWLWLHGRNPYLDNPFEREAYNEAP